MPDGRRPAASCSPKALPVSRSRTAPLRGLMTHAKGGFYHDGRFADLAVVVEHYNQFLKLSLSDSEKRDLVEYLKSL